MQRMFVVYEGWAQSDYNNHINNLTYKEITGYYNRRFDAIEAAKRSKRPFVVLRQGLLLQGGQLKVVQPGLGGNVISAREFASLGWVNPDPGGGPVIPGKVTGITLTVTNDNFGHNEYATINAVVEGVDVLQKVTWELLDHSLDLIPHRTTDTLIEIINGISIIFENPARYATVRATSVQDPTISAEVTVYEEEKNMEGITLKFILIQSGLQLTETGANYIDPTNGTGQLRFRIDVLTDVNGNQGGSSLLNIQGLSDSIGEHLILMNQLWTQIDGSTQMFIGGNGSNVRRYSTNFSAGSNNFNAQVTGFTPPTPPYASFKAGDYFICELNI